MRKGWSFPLHTFFFFNVKIVWVGLMLVSPFITMYYFEKKIQREANPVSRGLLAVVWIGLNVLWFVISLSVFWIGLTADAAVEGRREVTFLKRILAIAIAASHLLSWNLMVATWKTKASKFLTCTKSPFINTYDIESGNLDLHACWWEKNFISIFALEQRTITKNFNFFF